jgi:hypothetical protein
MKSRRNWSACLGSAGLVVAIIAVVLSILVPEVRRFCGLDKIVPALQALAPNSFPPPSPTPNQLELENRRLQKELEAERAQSKTNGETTAALQARIDALNKQIAEMRDAQRRTTPAPELARVAPTTPSKTPDIPTPRQKLEHFIVEAPRAQSHGDTAIVYIRFTSTTPSRVKMLLAAGFLGDDKTFLVDDAGQRYDLDSSSGIGSCCFGFAGGDWKGGVLDLAPKGTADVTLTFRRRSLYGERERTPKNFTLTAELTIGDTVKLQTWDSLQWQASGSAALNIPDIIPR